MSTYEEISLTSSDILNLSEDQKNVVKCMKDIKLPYGKYSLDELWNSLSDRGKFSLVYHAGQHLIKQGDFPAEAVAPATERKLGCTECNLLAKIFGYFVEW